MPAEADDAMLEAALDESGARCHEHIAPRESGVPIDSDMTEEEANYINGKVKASYADMYAAMYAVAPAPPASPTAWRYRYRYETGNVSRWTYTQRQVDPFEMSEGYAAVEVEPLYVAAPPEAPVPTAEVRKVLEQCQKTLATLTDPANKPDDSGVNVISAWAQCVEAETAARDLLKRWK
jgi:hypothetical protein